MPSKGKQVAPRQDFKIYSGTINNFNRFHLLAQEDEDRCEDWWYDEDDERDEDGEDNTDNDEHQKASEIKNDDGHEEASGLNNVDEHENGRELNQANGQKQGREHDRADHHKQDEHHKGDENHEDGQHTQGEFMIKTRAWEFNEDITADHDEDTMQSINLHQGQEHQRCRLLDMPGEVKNRIYYFAVMVPSSTPLPVETKYSDVQPWIPSWKGTTNLLLLSRKVKEEAEHLLNDKPNRVTIYSWQPMEVQAKLPLLAGCQTRNSSWAARKYTYEQLKCMNDLTIRIPYFEWRYWPDHVVHQGNYNHNTQSKLGRLGACRAKHPEDIQDQLYTLVAAASHNPNLKKLTLAFRRMNGLSRDDAEPDHWMYEKIQEKLGKLVRFRDTDFKICAVSYELPNAGDSVLDRVEVLAPWFNAARADWVRRIKEMEGTAKCAPDGALPEENPSGQGESSEEGESSSTTASKASDNSDDTWGAEYDREKAARLEAYLKPTTVDEFDPWIGRAGESLQHHTKSDHEVKGWYPCRYQGVSKGRDHRCIYCHRDVRNDWSNKEFPMLYIQHCEDGEEWLGECEATKTGTHCYPKLGVSDEL